MSQKKKRIERGQVEETPDSESVTKDRGGWWLGFIVASVVIAVILIFVGVFYYREYVGPFRRTVIVVDNDQSIRMDYFLKRIRLTGAEPMQMLYALTNEQLVKLVAPGLGISVSAADIDAGLLSIARGQSENITESEFKEWYRQQLNSSKLSDAEFREIVAIGVMAELLRADLAKKLPTVAEQVHLYSIAVATEEDANKVKARWKAGENFSTLAREVSLDGSKKDGGDLGWIARGASIPPGFEEVAFGLKVGEVSDPLPYISDPTASEEAVYYLLMVSEKADARELDEAALQQLRATVLDKWLANEVSRHTVKFYGLDKGAFDSETLAWINYQLAKK